MKTKIILLFLLLVSCGGGQGNSWLNHPIYLEHTERLKNLDKDCSVIIIGDSRVQDGAWEDYNSEWCDFGIGGDTAWGILNRLDAITGKYFCKVFIQVGYNDLYGGELPEAISFYLSEIKRILEENGCEVVITSTILTDNEYMNIGINYLNSITDNLDINIELAPEGILINTWDGVHLTAEGYETFYKLIGQAS